MLRVICDDSDSNPDTLPSFPLSIILCLHDESSNERWVWLFPFQIGFCGDKANAEAIECGRFSCPLDDCIASFVRMPAASFRVFYGYCYSIVLGMKYSPYHLFFLIIRWIGVLTDTDWNDTHLISPWIWTCFACSSIWLWACVLLSTVALMSNAASYCVEVHGGGGLDIMILLPVSVEFGLIFFLSWSKSRCIIP